MAKKKRNLKEIVISREGSIKEGDGLHHDAWILHRKYVREGHDVALAALKLGYHVGDRLAYEAIVEKQKRIVIKRYGIIKEGSIVLHSDIWILHEEFVREGRDVARAALKLGYRVGDGIRYKAVVREKDNS